MTDPNRRLTAIALAATLVLAACGGSAAPIASAGAAAGTPVATGTPGSTSTPTPTSAPSVAPGKDLSTLTGDWVASIENVRLNSATGKFVGGTITVDGGRIRLTATGPNDASASTGAAGRVGPTTIKNCKPKSCEVQNSPLPWLMSVLGDGSVAMLGIVSLKQIDAGAGVCGAPAVAGAGVVTITGGNKISFVTGEAGGFGVGSGTDPCAGASYQIVWTQVLTKAP